MISISIDVSKIKKEKLYKGAKGLYLDAVLIETPDNQYGNDYMVVQSVSKEEREQGIRGEILGNAKIIVKRDNAPPPEDNISTEGSNKDFEPPF